MNEEDNRNKIRPVTLETSCQRTAVAWHPGALRLPDSLILLICSSINTYNNMVPMILAKSNSYDVMW